jgi:glyoxylase I family protein
MLRPVDLAGLHHVALTVSDLDASTTWYRDVLGLPEQTRLEGENRRWAVLEVPGSAQQLGLVEHTGVSGPFAPQNLGLDHVAFSVRTADDLASWASRLEQRSIASSGVIDTPFGGMLHFHDPDGIALSLFWIR